MKKKVFLIISVVAIFIAITGTILFYKNKSISYITIPNKFYNIKFISNETWWYRYTDKYDEKTHQWDFTNATVYVLNNGKWEIAKGNEYQSSGNVESIKVEKKPKGAYEIMEDVVSHPKNTSSFLEDSTARYIVDCATSKITEGN